MNRPGLAMPTKLSRRLALTPILWLVALLCLPVQLFCLGGNLVWAAEAPRIEVLLSEQLPAYQQAVEAFSASLASGYAIHTHVLDLMSEDELGQLDRPGRLIVPVGVRATQRISDIYAGRAAVLALLLPRAAMESMRWRGDINGKVSAVYLDQPLQRSLALIRQVMPRAARVGIIVDEGETANVRAYRAAAHRQKLILAHETVTSQGEVALALQRLLARIDVLLLLPDPLVVNEQTARVLLVSSYREHVPVIAFSRGLVNAGAVAAVVSDPADIGREGALLAQRWNPETGALPPPRVAGNYAVVLNRRVAGSLNIQLDGDVEIWRRLRAGEGR